MKSFKLKKFYFVLSSSRCQYFWRAVGNSTHCALAAYISVSFITATIARHQYQTAIFACLQEAEKYCTMAICNLNNKKKRANITMPQFGARHLQPANHFILAAVTVFRPKILVEVKKTRWRKHANTQMRNMTIWRCKMLINQLRNYIVIKTNVYLQRTLLSGLSQLLFHLFKRHFKISNVFRNSQDQSTRPVSQ